MSEGMIERARDFAIQAHRYQRYGDQPYQVHLGEVVQVLKDFGVFDPETLAAAWLHDTIEDTGETRMSLAKTFGFKVARLVHAVSGEGPNRRARNRSIYLKITEYPEAAVIKCADRIANVEASERGSRHHQMYANEQQHFERVIREHVPAAMWDRLQAAFEGSIPTTSLGAKGHP